MFIGEYRHNIDAKGRLMLPVKFREKLGEEFIFSRGLDKCVCIYPIEEWKNFTAKIEELPVARERHVRRYFFSGACEGTPDAQGRVTITQTHREFADLKKEVAELKEENEQYYDYWVDSFNEIAFYDEHIVFVADNGTDLYHKYDCSVFQNCESFWAYNTEAAEGEGYKPCSRCCD